MQLGAVEDSVPTPTEILAGLAAIANQAVGVAITWHLVLGAVLVALGFGWRPSQRVAAALIATPLASVAVLAFAFASPFNGVMFAAATVAVLTFGLVGDPRPVARGAAWTWWAGVAMIAYGWVYPHFLDGPATAYLYAAPVGLVPCPTLAVAIGFALLGGGLGTRAWRLVLAVLGLFYGLFGALRLGVTLDVGLVGGAIALAATQLAPLTARNRVAPQG
jgi:hypothetical protein